MKFGTNRRYQKILIIKEKYNGNYLYFINCLFFSILKHGKKFLALKLFLNILNLLKKKFKQPLFIIFKLIRRILHSKIYIKIQHVGPIPYAIPVMTLRKSIFLSKIWLLSSARARFERTFPLRIFSEICDIKKNKKTGAILKKLQYYNYIKQSQTNLKFLRYIKLKRNLIVNTKFNFTKVKNFIRYRFNKRKLPRFLWNLKHGKKPVYFRKFKGWWWRRRWQINKKKIRLTHKIQSISKKKPSVTKKKSQPILKKIQNIKGLNLKKIPHKTQSISKKKPSVIKKTAQSIKKKAQPTLKKIQNIKGLNLKKIPHKTQSISKKPQLIFKSPFKLISKKFQNLKAQKIKFNSPTNQLTSKINFKQRVLNKKNKKNFHIKNVNFFKKK